MLKLHFQSKWPFLEKHISIKSTIKNQRLLLNVRCSLYCDKGSYTGTIRIHFKPQQLHFMWLTLGTCGASKVTGEKMVEHWINSTGEPIKNTLSFFFFFHSSPPGSHLHHLSFSFRHQLVYRFTHHYKKYTIQWLTFCIYLCIISYLLFFFKTFFYVVNSIFNT